MNTLLINTLIYRGSYVVLTFFLLVIRSKFRRKRLLGMLFWMIIAGLFIRGRFIEPSQLVVEEYNIGIGAKTTVALIGDMHLGVYKDRNYLQNVVNVINSRSDVDMVMIAGDFLYNPTNEQTVKELFAPLASLDKPVYAVLGNHDVGVPGDPTIRLPLVKALEEHGVIVLHNDIVWVNNFFLIGMGPHMAGESDTWLLNQVSINEKVVVLSHNPDVVDSFPNTNADLTLVGHTHCGQVRPPFLYNSIREHLVPVEGDFDCGLTQEKNTTLFITPGIGEVMLPIRFNNPPTVSILHI